MKHCDACTVDFTGDMARCPLCQNELRGEASPAAFPAQQIYLRPRRLAVEIITFVTGAILLLHGFFSYLFSWPIPIASASAAALIISVLFINSAILRRAAAASPHVSIFLYHAGDCAGLVCGDDESCRHHVRHTDHVSGFAGL